MADQHPMPLDVALCVMAINAQVHHPRKSWDLAAEAFRVIESRVQQFRAERKNPPPQTRSHPMASDEMFKDELATAKRMRAMGDTRLGVTIGVASECIEAAETIEKLVTALQILRAENAARAKQPQNG